MKKFRKELFIIFYNILLYKFIILLYKFLILCIIYKHLDAYDVTAVTSSSVARDETISSVVKPEVITEEDNDQESLAGAINKCDNNEKSELSTESDSKTDMCDAETEQSLISTPVSELWFEINQKCEKEDTVTDIYL